MFFNNEKNEIFDKRAVKASNSPEETNRLIEEFLPYLKTRVAKYDASQREDLFSVAMMAFYEAIQKYDITKGHFFSFANSVIYKRIIDCIRTYYRPKVKTVSLEQEYDEYQSGQSNAIEEISIRYYEAQSRHELLVNELEQFCKNLTSWGITLDTLYKRAPKQKRLLETYRMAVTKITQCPDTVRAIKLKRYFPMKTIVELTGLPPKTLERARTFILASLLIKTEDFDLLSDYVVFRQ